MLPDWLHKKFANSLTYRKCVLKHAVLGPQGGPTKSSFSLVTARFFLSVAANRGLSMPMSADSLSRKINLKNCSSDSRTVHINEGRMRKWQNHKGEVLVSVRRRCSNGLGSHFSTSTFLRALVKERRSRRSDSSYVSVCKGLTAGRRPEER